MLCSFPEQLPPTAPLRRRSSRPFGRRDSPSPATRQVPTACLSCSHFRNIATYEEQYAADNGGAYFGGTATSAAPLQGFSPSQNVTVVVTNVAGPPPSWSATATHSQSAKTCDMTNGVITCA